jgi:hypothetical protein
MNWHFIDRSIRGLNGLSRAGVLAAAVAAAILASSATSRTALAQQPDPAANLRYEAPIGHRQPRIQDLPPDVAQDEKKMQDEQDALDRKLETSICRGC